MFPIHNPSGRLVGFGGRTLGDDKAKYINTNETDRFHKGLILYGLHQAKREIRETSRAVLCEGYFDVIGAVACGVEGAVAGMGTALTPEQAKLLSRFAEEVVIAYDGDTAGENAGRRALPLLLAERLAVRRARFPGGHDPDSLRLAEGEAAVAEAIRVAEDAVVAELERIIPPNAGRDPQVQAKAATAVAELLRPIPDAILRHGYARLAADRLDVPVEMLARRTGSAPESPSERRQERQRPASPREPAHAGDGPRLVRSLEEQVLERLIQGEEPLPAVDELPPPEVFFGTECRNIYRAFRALYAGGAGSRPDARAMQAALGYEGEAVDQMARILLEGSFASGRVGLLESLDKLTHRWLRQRKQEIAAEIREAARRKDGVRLDSVLKERDSLNRSLHPGSRPSASGGAV